MTKRTPDPVLQFDFEDGRHRRAVVDVEFQMLMLHAGMALSGEPALELQGKAYLRKVALLATKARISTAKNKAAEKNTKVTEALRRRVQETYLATVKDRGVWGAIGVLERKFKLSAPTVREIVAPVKSVKQKGRK